MGDRPQAHLDAVESHFRQFVPHLVTLERRESSIIVRPVQGSFDIAVYDDGEEAMVAAARWHTHFETPDEAAACVRWLLTPYARIAHEYKGSILAAVWIEQGIHGHWEPSDPVYFLNPEYPPEWKLLSGQEYTQKRVWQDAVPPPFEPQAPPPTTPGLTSSRAPQSIGLFD